MPNGDVVRIGPGLFQVRAMVAFDPQGPGNLMLPGHPWRALCTGQEAVQLQHFLTVRADIEEMLCRQRLDLAG